MFGILQAWAAAFRRAAFGVVSDKAASIFGILVHTTTRILDDNRVASTHATTYSVTSYVTNSGLLSSDFILCTYFVGISTSQQLT